MENNIQVYEVYFYNDYDQTEHEHRYFRNEKNAEKKYKQLCKKYDVKPRFCFTDQDGFTIWYGKIYFDD